MLITATDPTTTKKSFSSRSSRRRYRRHQQQVLNNLLSNKLIRKSSFSATSPTSSLTLSSTSSSSRKTVQQKFIENKFDKEFIINNRFSKVHRQQILQRVHRRQQFSGGLGQPLVCNNISMDIILPLINQLHIKRQTTPTTTTRFKLTTSST